MIHIKSGSSLLVVLLIIVTLTAFCASFMRSTTFLFDVALQRTRSQQQYRATEALVQYAIALVYEHTLDPINETRIVLPEWWQKSTGSIRITPSGGQYTLVVQLINDRVVTNEFHATLTQHDSHVKLEGWTVII